MERETASGDIGAATLEVGLQYHRTIDFDRRGLRRALVKGAAIVRKEARRSVSRRAISNPGEMPGQQSGELKRAIGVVSKGSKGGWIKVGVRKTPAMQEFYPAFLFYGSDKTGLAARGNYITAALKTKRDAVRDEVRSGLKNSLVPR